MALRKTAPSRSRLGQSLMDDGQLLTRWTARIAMLLYALALALRLQAQGCASILTFCRLAWTAGCSIYLAHVICAFQFIHHWSHAEAYAITARQTNETVGLDWGGGLYFNYLFTLVWGIDVVWWWEARLGYEQRPRSIEWAIQGFLAFMAFNATVVFATGLTRWVGVAATVILTIIVVRLAATRRAPLARRG